MGSWDCYCTLCSGPLGLQRVVFGSRKAKDLKNRWSRIEEQQGKKCNVAQGSGAGRPHEAEICAFSVRLEEQKRDGGKELGSPGFPEVRSCELNVEATLSQDNNILASITSVPRAGSTDGKFLARPETQRDDTFSRAFDIPILESWDPHPREDNGGQKIYQREKHSYDPVELSIEDVKWIDRCRCLCLNPTARDNTRTFFSGRGRYDNYGDFGVVGPAHDPNDNGKQELQCYASDDPDEPIAFPFHEACFMILLRYLGYKELEQIDGDILYQAMLRYQKDYMNRLPPYGSRSDQSERQFWDCVPGEEYFVCDPGMQLAFKQMFESLLPFSLVAATSLPLTLDHKVRSDPLQVLHYDILYNVIGNLSTTDTLSLLKSSQHVLNSTRHKDFWIHMSRTRIVPWLWELEDLLSSSNLVDTVDMKGLFLWLDKVTRCEFGMTGSLIGIANRRRIWNVCHQFIHHLYIEELDAASSKQTSSR